MFWDEGLDGRGQVIGIGDSGIDMHSCFFRDPAVPFTVPSDGTREWRAPEHRKVVYYWGLADPRFQDLVGHGTHTSGSVAGLDPSDPNGRATGAAKSAKLAFADLSATASGDVNAPQDMERNYFPNIYGAGARVFSGGLGYCSRRLHSLHGENGNHRDQKTGKRAQQRWRRQQWLYNVADDLNCSFYHAVVICVHTCGQQLNVIVAP